MIETAVATALHVRAVGHVPEVRRRLRGAFPRASGPDLDDAVQHAFLEAIEHTDAFNDALEVDGDQGLRWLVMVAWRFLRGEFRRLGVKMRADLPDHDAFPDARPSAVTVLESREALDRVETLLDRAAALHGPACQQGLRDALLARICEEDTDANAARRHGVPREYVNRARRWIADQLRGT